LKPCLNTVSPSLIAVSVIHRNTVAQYLHYGSEEVKTKLKYKTDETEETSHKILAYLMDNPNARDTLEGIVDWWLLQQDIKRNVALIRKTVDGLLHKGLLLERQGNDRTKYYQVNRKRLPEISALIERRG
jgi:hypothetical protein